MNNKGQILPLVAGFVVLNLIILLAAFTFIRILEMRTENQVAADLAALAGANKLSQGIQAQRTIAFIIWSRNTVLDGLYVVAAIVSIGSAGLATEVFAIPRYWQNVTAPVVAKLEKADEYIGRAAVVAAVKDGASIAKANGLNGNSYAIPIPLFKSSSQKSQQQLDLERLINMYIKRIEQAQAELDAVLSRYYQIKAKLELEPSNEKLQSELSAAEKEVKEKSGRIGGLTRWKNQRERELAELKIKQTQMLGGQDGVIGFMWRTNKNLSASSLIGAVNSGSHVSMAAAKVIDSQTNQVIGEEAVKKLTANIPGVEPASQGFFYVLKALSLFTDKSNRFLSDFGLLTTPFGRFIKGILPPNIKAAKPALVSIKEVLKGESQLESYLKAAQAWVK